MTIYFGDLLWLWCIGYVVTVWRNYMMFQKLLVNIHMVFLRPMKKWHLYQRKHINTSAFCTTKIQICPQKFWNLATLSFFSLKSHFSKIKFLFLFLVSSLWNLNPICPKFSIQTSSMLSHKFLFTPNWHHPTMPLHHLSSLSFTLPSTAPLQYLSILGPTTIKSHPHLIFHTILFFFYFFLFFLFLATERTKEINIQVQCRWVPFNFFFFNFKPIFSLVYLLLYHWNFLDLT